MSSPVALKLDFEYSNNYRFMDCLIYMFSRCQKNYILSKTECEILREYLLRGYSSETKKHIVKSLKTTITSVNTLNCNLQKKGFLMPDPNKQINKTLNPELLKLKQFYETDSQRKVLLINFIDENV